MRQIVKTKRIGDFRYIPVRLFEQDLRFLYYTGGYDICRRTAQPFLQYLIKMVNMHR